jgi:hypothetical protein
LRIVNGQRFIAGAFAFAMLLLPAPDVGGAVATDAYAASPSRT